LSLSTPCRIAVALALLVSGVCVTSNGQAQCVDEALREQLVGKRAYRGVVPRLFKKALRHELSPMGGWLAADMSDGAPIWGGAYTFHFTEDLGLEAAYFRTRQTSSVLEAVVDRQPNLVDIARAEETDVQLFLGHFVWSLAYGKVRWLGGAIGRFDFYLSLGAGAIDDERGSPGLTGSGGFGLKFYLAQWLALRLDVRDHVHSQRTVLGVDRVVNDISAMGGASIFFPFHN